MRASGRLVIKLEGWNDQRQVEGRERRKDRD